MFTLQLASIKHSDYQINISNRQRNNLCIAKIATVLRCILLAWTTCFGPEDHLQVHIEPR